MLNQKSIQKLLGFDETIHLNADEMAENLILTVFPSQQGAVSEEVTHFTGSLIKTLKKLGVQFIPFQEAIEHTPKKRKLKKGVSVLVSGKQPIDNHPLDYISSLSTNSIITILGFPENLHQKSSFQEHFDTAFDLFAYHLSNIVIAVDQQKWMLYNYNAAHPIYDIGTDFEQNVLQALIPKIYAPISPLKLSDFEILSHRFDVSDSSHKPYVEDMVQAGKLFERTGLFPKGKSLAGLSFRSDFHKRVAKTLLDNRNGMSFGFLARQLPTEIGLLLPFEQFKKELNQTSMDSSESVFSFQNNLYLLLHIGNKKYILKTPEVWMLTQRSGADKTHIEPRKDLIKLGLKNGKMQMQIPQDIHLGDDYRPSFDTKVILAHALGNAIIASVLNILKPGNEFFSHFEKSGMALAHWHGYFQPEAIPRGWQVYGRENPNVACSSPQSAIYALDGKLKSFTRCLENLEMYRGDIHIEPQHGINVSWPSLTDLAEFVSKTPKASVLGNEYWDLSRQA